MEDKNFDAFTQALVGSNVSRKQLLQRFVGGMVGIAAATIIPDRVWAAGGTGSNSVCAHFCDAVFGDDTPAADACISAAAHHQGLCYTCGPLGGTGGVCGTYSSCGSDTYGTCFCGTSAEGTTFCFSDVFCALDATCNTSADCASGFTCVVSTCCGSPNVCLPICGTPAAAAAAAAPTGPRPSGA